MSDTIAEWARANGLDAGTEQAVREFPPHIAEGIVAELGIIQNAKNPNAIVMARLRRGTPQGRDAARHPAAPLAPDIRGFVAANGLDEKTENWLRDAAPEVTAAVIAELGTIENARNPNAIVMARLRRGVPQGRDAGLMPGLMAAPPMPQLRTPQYAQLPAAGPSAMVPSAVVPRYVTPVNPAVVRAHTPQPAVLRAVPTAAAPHPGAASAGAAPSADVEAFIAANRLDERTQEALRSAPHAAAVIAAELGEIQNARSPDAIVMARLARGVPQGRDAGQPPPQVLQGPDIAGFVAANGLDGRTEEELRAAPPDVVGEIIAELGTIQNARNPNAIVLTRLKRGVPQGRDGAWARRDAAYLGAGAVPQLAAPLPIAPPHGDWGGDRRMPVAPPAYAGRPAGGPAALPQLRPAAPPAGGGWAGGDDIDAFCAANGLDAATESELRRADPATALTVIAELGQIIGARNPSAIVSARLRRGVPQGRDAGAAAAAPPAAAPRFAPYPTPAAAPPHAAAVVVGDAISAFVQVNGLDARTEAALREMADGGAGVADELGTMQGARNPNAVVMVRIRRGVPQGRDANFAQG